jgi:hypothetical protein
MMTVEEIKAQITAEFKFFLPAAQLVAVGLQTASYPMGNGSSFPKGEVAKG